MKQPPRVWRPKRAGIDEIYLEGAMLGDLECPRPRLMRREDLL